MEYQKIINLLDNRPSHPSKFRTKNWVEMITCVQHIAPVVKLNLKIQC